MDRNTEKQVIKPISVQFTTDERNPPSKHINCRLTMLDSSNSVKFYPTAECQRQILLPDHVSIQNLRFSAEFPPPRPSESAELLERQTGAVPD